MVYVLVILTLISLALALAMGAVLVKFLREERLRSDARVEALIAMSTGASEVERPAGHASPRWFTDASPGESLVHREYEPELANNDVHVTGDDVQRSAPVPGVGALFVEPELASPWIRRLAIAAGIAAGVTILTFSFTAWPRASTPPPATAQAGAATLSLDLLSLGHTQKAEGLTINGLVQNPRGGVPLAQVTATAFLFATDGTFLGSGRAPLDFRLLPPGDESPFVITVPVNGVVARYRIGFRDKDGNVIAHVDRRTGDTAARREGT